MSMPFWLRNILKHGLWLGLSLCLYTTLMWLTRLDSAYLSRGQYLDIAVVAVPVGFIVAAIQQQRQRAYLHLWQRVGIAVGVALLAEVVYRPYLAFYHTTINPTWFAYVLDLKRAELLAAGQSAAQITQELARLKVRHAGQAGVFSGAWVSALILPTLIALLTLPFLRNKPEVRLPQPLAS